MRVRLNRKAKSGVSKRQPAGQLWPNNWIYMAHSLSLKTRFLWPATFYWIKQAVFVIVHHVMAALITCVLPAIASQCTALQQQKNDAASESDSSVKKEKETFFSLTNRALLNLNRWFSLHLNILLLNVIILEFASGVLNLYCQSLLENFLQTTGFNIYKIGKNSQSGNHVLPVTAAIPSLNCHNNIRVHIPRGHPRYCSKISTKLRPLEQPLLWLMTNLSILIFFSGISVMVFQLPNKDKKEKKRVYSQWDVTAAYVLLCLI